MPEVVMPCAFICASSAGGICGAALPPSVLVKLHSPGESVAALAVPIIRMAAKAGAAMCRMVFSRLIC